MPAPTRVQRPIFARFFDWVSPRMEAGGMADHRRRLVDGLVGDVIEIGVGNGVGFAHYPIDVDRLVAVEPEPHLRERARLLAAQAPFPIEMIDRMGHDLPHAPASFDAAVVSCVLCSVDDQLDVLRELRRVLRPGGQLRFLEHVRADRGATHLLQRMADATLWPTLFGGCHTHRDTAEAIRAAGFTIERFEQLRFPDASIPVPSAPHILGTARAPAP